MSGFEEIPNTADWAMRVWAPNLPALFAEAAHGMNSLSGAQSAHAPLVLRTFNANAFDAESLLVAFLSELVYLAEQEHLVFDDFTVDINGSTLKIILSGAPLLSIDKSIKAVTYHNLHILKTEFGFQVEIVFDV
jgi:SHS2 domain-containing protein